eukprot:Colp12_sorted_trinity150504_noHs@7078
MITTVPHVASKKPKDLKEADAPSSSAPSKLPDSVKNMGANHPLKILLVEDNPVNQRVTGLFLKQLGYECAYANDGRESLEVLKNTTMYRQEYDVILMDLNMPEMDGLETAQKIQQMFTRSDQPTIVALTASESVEDTINCMRLGFEHYLSKPICAMDLANVLIKCKPIKRTLKVMDQVVAPKRRKGSF